MSDRILQLHPSDTVAVVLEPIGDIPVGHKVALVDIPAGGDVIKYGHSIGHATQAIPAGAWVHTHNLATNLGEMLDYTYASGDVAATPAACAQTFPGYVRAGGQVGVRNELWVLPTVGCVNRTAETLARRAHARWAGQGIDGVYAFPHPYGCSQLGDDHIATQQILAGLARHPNAGGVLIVGLGCENNHIAAFKDVLGDYDPQRMAFLNCQDVDDEFANGEALLAQLARHAAAERQPVPVSTLVVGLKCGGSDAFSGITANPLVGALSDRLTACGGSTVLTEVPEMFGAEQLLMARTADRETFDRTVAMINAFKGYFIRYGQVIYENPSPGNKAGGITTLEEKSLGCTQKAGTAPVVDVLAYGEAVRRPGVTLLNGPGNDIVAVTALAAAGCHLILFTTGRGTPLGAPVPTVKIATNTALAAKKPGWIDVNAGVLLDGTSLNDAADALFATVLAVAGGQTTRNEDHDFREIAIWKDGVTL